MEENTKPSIKNLEIISQLQKEKKQLIPGLPDEIAMECLVRVPYQSHSSMKSVCHDWQNLISHPSFYQERRKAGSAEQLVCLVQPDLPNLDRSSHDHALDGNNTTTKEEQQQKIQSPPQYALSIYNATHNVWQRTRPEGGIPMFCQCLALPSTSKILLLGGWEPTTLEPVPHVYILDFTGANPGWKRGAPMLVPRSFFACAVVGPSTVYVAGGHDGQKNALRSAEVYDVDRDEWKVLPDMIEERDECEGLAWEGDSRFWVVSGYGSESQGQFRSDAECYDPDTGTWSKVDQVWPFSSTSPRGVTTATVCANSNRYQWWWFLGGEQQCLQQQQSGSQVVFRENDNVRWEIVTSSIPFHNCIRGPVPCVTTLGYVAQEEGKRNHQNKHQLFVMNTGGGRRSSSLACGECYGEGAFILDTYSNSGTTKRSHIHTPVAFSGLPYSASYLII